MIPGNAEKFDRPYLLLCEGPGDQRFFHRLIEQHQIGDDFSIRYPHKEGKWAGGRSSFSADLRVVSVNEDFIKNVRAILVVSDRDDDPEKSLAEVKAEIAKVSGLPVPAKEGVVAKNEGNPRVVILMLPTVGDGNLETLCLESAYAKWGLKPHLDRFVENSPANEWGKSKQSKMRVQAILAATNSNQPDAGFTSHWTQPAQFQIPLDHACFADLVNFLKGFRDLVEA